MNFVNYDVNVGIHEMSLIWVLTLMSLTYTKKLISSLSFTVLAEVLLKSTMYRFMV